MKDVVLCADSESLVRPWLIGLDGIDIESIEWIESFSSAKLAREYVKARRDEISEVWIVSTDDVANLNMAAAVRKDAPELSIKMVLSERSGSSMSKANAAGVKSVLSPSEFARLFSIEIARRCRAAEVAAIEVSQAIPEKCARKTLDLNVPKVIKDASSSVESDCENKPSICVGNPQKSMREDEPYAASSAILPILSGSGGVGKSSFSAICAMYAASLDYSTALIDGDLQFGDLDAICAHSGSVSIEDVISDVGLVDQLREEAMSNGSIAFIGAPSLMEHSEELGACLCKVVLECAKKFEVVVVNTGNGWNESHAQLLETATSPIFLMDQRLSSIKNIQRAIDLCVRMGIATNSFRFALNRCSRNSIFSVLDVSSALQGSHVYELKDGGSDVEELLVSGQVCNLLRSGNEYISSIKTMLEDVLPLDKKRKTHNALFSESKRTEKRFRFFNKKAAKGMNLKTEKAAGSDFKLRFSDLVQEFGLSKVAGDDLRVERV